MQLRIQAMFIGAFMIACALCLASLASAEGNTAGATTHAALTKAHQSAITHAKALAKYMRGNETASKEVVLDHTAAIGSALHEASRASTALATEVRADRAKECVETMREHQSDAADQHKKLTDELTQSPLDAEAIRSLVGDIATELSDAEQENRRVATLERGVRKDAARGRVPVEQ
jgi:chemotaxis regulatin CheY-phosphate phosphatase CheZ